MKIGDKILCKKDFLIQTIPYILRIGNNKYYEIKKISSLSDITIKTDNGDIIFSTKIYSSASPYYLFDYFYTEKELRKLKLDNIHD